MGASNSDKTPLLSVVGLPELSFIKSTSVGPDIFAKSGNIL
jgi:hypothetical protein